eukprot:scaffold6526_cov148-Prasinococcus_capsulatus_cf.AAC.1
MCAVSLDRNKIHNSRPEGGRREPLRPDTHAAIDITTSELSALALLLRLLHSRCTSIRFPLG